MKAIKDIMEILQTGTAIRGVVPQELSPSYPIPVRTDTEVVLLSFYYASFGPPPATRNSLYPPNWLATVRSSDGELVDLKKNVPAYYGIDNPPDQPFATYVMTILGGGVSSTKNCYGFFYCST